MWCGQKRKINTAGTMKEKTRLPLLAAGFHEAYVRISVSALHQHSGTAALQRIRREALFKPHDGQSTSVLYDLSRERHLVHKSNIHTGLLLLWHERMLRHVNGRMFAVHNSQELVT